MRGVKTRAWIVAGALVAAAAIIWVMARPDRVSETRSVEATSAGPGSAAAISAPPTPSLPTSSLPTPSLPAAAGSNEPVDSLAHYPVDLEELRTRIPNNRYWELGAPTRDPELARARAERAQRSNTQLGRTQTGEATEPEIRAYYAEQRRISEDYLQLSLLVLAEKADQLPERDRGMFELSASLHRARLKQIERDLSDALARRRDRPR